jgi:hypothetical protein
MGLNAAPAWQKAAAYRRRRERNEESVGGIESSVA